MTDPHDALPSFEQALRSGELKIQAGALDRELIVHLDQPTPGVNRMTYAKLDGKKVVGLVQMVPAGFIDGLPCFQAGIAVAKKYRRKGHAARIFTAVVAEMKHGFARANIKSFYVEAIVSVDNEPSKRLAAATLSPTPAEVTDELSGLPALQYLLKV
ncbi:MAG: GNAT family N-acetyltransferase [Bradyrhizobium sp.]